MALKSKLIDVGKLQLDRDNPRLPEHVSGAEPAKILAYLHRHGVLEELAHSMADNGYFEYEPLVAVASGVEEEFVVIEGNRRLATLQVLLGLRGAEDLDFPGVELADETRKSLEKVPCYVVESREHAANFLGFRHIGGLKTWPPEAKARYVLKRIRALVVAGEQKPFAELARRVGSNSQGMRNSYIAIRTLIQARDDLGITVSELQSDRFGVWARCMNSADLKDYIGLDAGSTYESIESAMNGLKQPELAEVVADLSSRTGDRRPLVGDSRDVTTYGRVLRHERAKKALRKYDDLSVARQIVDTVDLPSRLAKLADACEALTTEIARIDPGDATGELVEAAGKLKASAAAILAVAESRASERTESTGD